MLSVQGGKFVNRREMLGVGASLAVVSLMPAVAGPATVREWTPQEFHAARRFLETRFGRIAYVERGTGPVALFLHGWPLNGFQWRGAMARLEGSRRCVAADFMGLGYSEVPPTADLSPMQQMNMLIAVLDGLGVDKADFVSNDSGTGVALLLAAYHPERVRSMLITNGDVHTNSPPIALMPILEEARADKLVQRFDRQLADNRIAQTDDGLGVVYTHPSILTPELVETYLRPLVSSPVRRRQCQEYGLAFLPSPIPAIKERLNRFRAPARMVWATADPLFPTKWAHWLDRNLPDSKGVRLVRGAKLFFPEEFPQIIANEAVHLWT
jgi:haloalkane dehalogenase